MNISALCKTLALRELYETLEVSPGSGLLYYELERLWPKTGLRQEDLAEAIALALMAGEVSEIVTHEGHLALLTEAGYQLANSTPSLLEQIEEHAVALTTLERAKARRRSGPANGRRLDDRTVYH